MRRRTHSQLRQRVGFSDQLDWCATGVEQLLWPVRVHPLLQQPQVILVLAYAGQRHLVRPPGAFHLSAVDLLGTRPALRLRKMIMGQRGLVPIPSGVPRAALNLNDHAVRGGQAAAKR